MLTLSQKIIFLKEILNAPHENYAESFKTEIGFFFEDLEEDHILFHFLNPLNTKEEIEAWVEKLCSRIVLKHDPPQESLNGFIIDFLEFGY